jgi:hypothetical protein
MTAPFAPVAFPSTDPVGAVLGRLGQLDATLRRLDPTWLGVATTSAAGGAVVRASEFSSHLSAAAGEGVSAGPSLASQGTPLGLFGLDRLGPRTAGLGKGDAVAAAPGGERRFAEAGRYAVVEPLRNARLTQDFGPSDFTGAGPATVDGVYYPHYHDGLDLAAPLGTKVRAIAAGEVVFAGRMADGNVLVRIRHADDSESWYGHLGAGLDVQAGDKVARGERIGVVGLTGNTTGPHLHLELWRNGRTIDPAPWLEKGRLPDTPAHLIDAVRSIDSVAGAERTSAADAGTLARFDAVADEIPFARQIRRAAIHAGIDPLLLASMVRAESGFRPDAVSYAGAMGLTQLMPATARSLGVDDPFDPAENLRGGAKYLAGNLRIYGRVDLALAAYQAGKGAVAAAGGIPDSPTTRNYIDRILGYWSGYLREAT